MSAQPTTPEVAETAHGRELAGRHCSALPCPFCGNQPEFMDIHSDEIRARDDAARAKGALIPGAYTPWKSYFLNIRCAWCNVSFDASLHAEDITDSKISENRNRLLSRWNTRWPNVASDLSPANGERSNHTKLGKAGD